VNISKTSYLIKLNVYRHLGRDVVQCVRAKFSEEHTASVFRVDYRKWRGRGRLLRNFDAYVPKDSQPHKRT